MYKRILLPTDGSEASRRAIDAGVRFAKELGAEVIGVTVMPEFHTFTLDAQSLEATEDDYGRIAGERAGRILADVESAAQAQGVAYTCEQVVNDHPYEAILAAARQKNCDLIVMASHGRAGLKGLLLGSETQKVLVHSSIPVLVHR
jgi:nucleotide-binding universal stress UspA family protein